jgi:predicted DNA-binding transcriptional regulator AlpA
MDKFDAKIHAEIDAELAELKARAQASPYISIQEVAEQFGISIRTLRREQAAGRMPTRVKRSRQLVYLKNDIDECFRARGRESK